VIGRIWAIGLNTFREASRNLVLYGICFVAFVLILSASVLGQMSLHEEARVARDVGLSGVSLFGSLTAIVLGVSLLYSEIERRTIHSIVSKPIRRFEFVLGKYLGMAMMLTLLVLVFTASLALLLYIEDVSFSAAVVKALILSYVEVLLVAGIAVFFSSFTSPFLSGIFTLMLFVAGRTTGTMRELLTDDKLDGAIELGMRAGLYLLPNLHMFAISGSQVDGEYVSVHSDFVPWSYVAEAGLYGLVYLSALLALSVFIFNRRDFA